MLIYWDEVLLWQYQKHNNEDQLWLQLTDGQTETIECFNRNKIVPYFKIYAKGKERQLKPRGAGVQPPVPGRKYEIYV